MPSPKEKKSDSTEEPKRKDLALVICPNDEKLTDEKLAELLEKKVQEILES